LSPLIIVIYMLVKIGTGEVLVGRCGLFPFFLKMLTGHIVIYGRTGSGKSNTAKLLASKISRRIPVLILDWAGEYVLEGFERLIPGDNFQLNPLEYIYGELSEHIDFLVDLFGDVFRFSDPMKFMFRRALNRSFSKHSSPTLTQVLEILDSIPLKSYYDHEVVLAVFTRYFNILT